MFLDYVVLYALVSTFYVCVCVDKAVYSSIHFENIMIYFSTPFTSSCGTSFLYLLRSLFEGLNTLNCVQATCFSTQLSRIIDSHVHSTSCAIICWGGEFG